MQSSASAQQALRQYGIPLWASEEFSTFSDETGALCWIRIVVDDYVTGYMTMTSSWYLVSGSYPSIPFWSCHTLFYRVAMLVKTIPNIPQRREPLQIVKGRRWLRGDTMNQCDFR